MNKLFSIITCIFLLLALSCTNKSNMTNEEATSQLKVMSFNIWVGGGKSISVTADVILKSEADIVGIQESSLNGKNMAVYIADSLGWYAYTLGDRSPSIISKYPIVDTTTNKYGVKVSINEKQQVWMFNIHLMYCPYEPYQLNNIEYCGKPMLKTAEEAVASAIATRGQEVELVIADLLEAQKDGVPVFLTGDFNEPSFLDWTSEAAKANLCKIPVEWPSTKAFATRAGMNDSYRAIYPDEVKNPGHTWTPLPETKAYKEVVDRIDFVLYHGKNVTPIKSELVGELSELSDIGFENYPSDHRAVISTFDLK